MRAEYALGRGKGAEMSENTQKAAAEAQEGAQTPQEPPKATETGNAAETKTFTQEQVDKMIKERLARAKSTPPADYEELKEKAAKYDEAQEAAKSDLQKATEKAERLEAELETIKAKQAHDEAVKEAAERYGVDEAILKRMAGDVDENAAFLQTVEKSRPKAPAYPTVNDPGEIPVKSITREDIAAIKDRKARHEAIVANMHLFQ